MSRDRKLAAILFADIVDYTALMQKDEVAASILLRHFQAELDDKVRAHEGEVVNFYGDGALCTFQIPLDAVRCGMVLQTSFRKEPAVPVRIGIHSGTVTVEGDKIFGNSVNIASRIESMGTAGGILFSKKVRDEVKNNPDLQITSMGLYTFKNVEEPLEVFALGNEGFVVPDKRKIKGKGNRVSNISYKKIIAGILGLVLALVLIDYFINDSEEVATNQELNALAVFPFAVKGSPDIAYLGEGIVDLVSARLDEIPGMNSIDPNRIFSAIENINAISRKPREAANLARTFGAAQFILGSIIEIDETIEITATKYNAAGEKLTATTVDGNKAGQIGAAVEQLIRTLVAEEMENAGLELSHLAALTSGNIESLKAYLEGEQAFRRGQYADAFELFSQATQYDSTFALAWMRMREAGSWNLGISTYEASSKWAKYVHLMPSKWQEYHRANVMYGMGDPQAIDLYERLIRKYGENRSFVNGLAEFIFHFNPVFGKSFTEAKPYLEQTLALDQHNVEALYHLGDIALFEKDTFELQQLLNSVDKNSEVYPLLQIYNWVLLDSIPAQELAELFDHPEFTEERYTAFLAPRKNLGINFENFEEVLVMRPNVEFGAINDALKNAIAGKEKSAYEAWLKLGQTKSDYRLNYAQWARCIPATLMVDSRFLPASEKYADLYEMVKDKRSPWDIYAATKYAVALGLEEEIIHHKERLADLADEMVDRPDQFNKVRCYQYSIKAFEAFSTDQHEMALLYLDSAQQFPFGLWEILNSKLDRSIMTAQIYADRGEFEKAIPQYEHLPTFFATPSLQGFATYQLSQWYERIGDRETALIKCELFLDLYKDCDPKYQKWVNETEALRDKLIAAMH